jgi:glycosyltransferase involved in cell wall biosynthesis
MNAPSGGARDPLFSVIVPTYDRAELVRGAVDSVLAQTVADLECIVVDDGTPSPLAASWKDDRVRVIRRDRSGGPSAARNTGMDEARGRYLAFLDDDDLFVPDRLATALEGLRRAPVALCWGRYEDEEGTASGRMLDGDVRDTVAEGMAPAMRLVAIERGVAPRFDESFTACEDLEWWLRLARTVTVATVPRIGCVVRRHTGPRHGTGTRERIDGRLRLLQMYDGYYRDHPRAAAFAWKRVGLLALAEGRPALARRALLRSLRLRPELRSAWHLARSIPGRAPAQPGRVA